MRRFVRFLRLLSFRCIPFLACSRHGRCFAHSVCDECGQKECVHP